MKKIIGGAISVFLRLAMMSSNGAQATDLNGATAVVQKFQVFKHNEIFCTTTGGDPQLSPANIGPKVAQYLTTDLGRLYMWAMCNEPNIPNSRYLPSYDFRFGVSRAEGGMDNAVIDGIVAVHRIRVQPGRLLPDGRAEVKVTFDWESQKNLSTIYTLTKENNIWKIDDIAPKGYATDMETLLVGSKSVKSEMMNAYQKAEKQKSRKS